MKKQKQEQEYELSWRTKRCESCIYRKLAGAAACDSCQNGHNLHALGVEMSPTEKRWSEMDLIKGEGGKPPVD